MLIPTYEREADSLLYTKKLMTSGKLMRLCFSIFSFIKQVLTVSYSVALIIITENEGTIPDTLREAVLV